MTEDIQVTVISTGFNTLDKNVRPVEKIEKQFQQVIYKT